MKTAVGVVLRTDNWFRNRWEWVVAADPSSYVWHGFTLTKRGAEREIDRIINGGKW